MKDTAQSKELKEFEAELESAINAPYNITCMGLYNHGKSTLLNALVGAFNNEVFKVADKVETSEVKTHYHNGIAYTDTPGLNAYDNHDTMTMKAIKNSDLNLFVHKLDSGEFDRNEIEFLQAISSQWESAEAFLDNTIFVLNDCGGQENSDIETIKAKILEQLKEAFVGENLRIEMLVVSPKSYQKGMLEDKKALIKDSNINELQSHIQDKKERFEQDNVRYTKLTAKLNQKINEIENEIKQYDIAIQQTKKYIDDKIRQANKELADMASS